MNITKVLHVLENTTETNESAIIEVQSFLNEIKFEVDKLHAINMLLKVNSVPEINNLLKRELILLFNNHPCDIKKPYVFISYSSKDWKYVYPHVIKMKFQGINVWIDVELENHSGEKWNTTVKQVLMKHQLKMIVFFMSENAFTSVPIFHELLFSQKDKFAGGPNKNFTPYLIPINIIESFDANLENFMNDLDDKELLEKQQHEVFELYKKYIDSSLDDDFYLNISTHFVAWTIFEYIFECSNDVKYLNGLDDIDLTKNKNFFIECINQQVNDLSINDETIFIEESISVGEMIIEKNHIEVATDEEEIVCTPTIDEITNNLFEGINSKEYQKIIDEYHNREDCLFNFVIVDNQVLIESYKGTNRETIKIPDYVHGFKESSFPFAEASNITHIELGKGLTNLDYMFWGCALERIDVSSWDVSNITSMRNTFFDCELRHIDGLSDWDVSNVKCMESMFNSCSTSYIGDLSSWDVSNVENMQFMFSDCNTSFVGDLSSWDVKKTTCFNNMFASSKIKYIGDISSWNIDKRDQIDNMFKNALFSHEFTSLKDSIVEYTEHLLDGIRKREYQKVIDEYHQKDEHLFEFVIVDNQVLIEKYVGKEREMIKIPDYVSGFRKQSAPFSRVQGLKHIKLGKNLTSLAYMFSLCEMETIDLSTWDVSNVTNMSGMFELCYSKHIIGLSSWDVSNVKDMSFMFCESHFESISDISNWNVSNVEDMSCMFDDSEIINIGDLSKWNVMNVKSMSGMFSYSNANYVGDLSVWDVSNVTDMEYMFATSEITNIGDISKWSVENVTDFSNMFNEAKLKTIGDISSWGIDQFANIEGMFENALFNYRFKNRKELTIEEISEHLLKDIKTDDECIQRINHYNLRVDKLFEFEIMDEDYSSWFWGDEKCTIEKRIFIKSYCGKNKDKIKIPDYVTGFIEESEPFVDAKDVKCIELGKNLRTLEGMFAYSNIEKIDLSAWDVSSIQNMGSMFKKCRIKRLEGLELWDVSNVRYMSDMFSGWQITTLPDLSSWDVSNVIVMSGMFRDCHELKFLGNLSKWPIDAKSILVSSMFKDTNKSLDVGNLSHWGDQRLADAYGVRYVEDEKTIGSFFKKFIK